MAVLVATLLACCCCCCWWFCCLLPARRRKKKREEEEATANASPKWVNNEIEASASQGSFDDFDFGPCLNQRASSAPPRPPRSSRKSCRGSRYTKADLAGGGAAEGETDVLDEESLNIDRRVLSTSKLRGSLGSRSSRKASGYAKADVFGCCSEVGGGEGDVLDLSLQRCVLPTIKATEAPPASPGGETQILDLDFNVKRTLLPTVKATDAGTGSSRWSSMTLQLPSPVKAVQRHRVMPTFEATEAPPASPGGETQILDLDLNVKRTLLPTVKATDAGTGSSRRSSMTLPLPSPVKAGQRRSTPIVNEHRGSLFDDL